jgi:hypothetical protein
MRQKLRGGCDNYDVCQDDLAWWRRKLDHGCDVCNDISVSDKGKQAAGCTAGQDAGAVLSLAPREADCLNPLKGILALYEAGCDMCTLYFVPQADKKSFNCANYDICKDSTVVNVSEKVQANCNICNDKSVPMSYKGLYQCTNYDFCYDETLPMGKKAYNGCDICDNDSVSDEDKTAHGCDPHVTYQDVYETALKWARSVIETHVSRHYALEVDPANCVPITIDTVAPV